MTYRELIRICNKTPEDECYDGICPYQKECRAFKNAVGCYPIFLAKALDVDFNTKIEVEE